jgi:ribosomal protein L29
MVKKSEIRELREKDVDELRQLLEADRKTLFHSKLERVTEGKRLGTEAKRLRRNIARYHTLINEKQAAAARAKVQA